MKYILILIGIIVPINLFAQGQITRPQKQTPPTQNTTPTKPSSPSTKSNNSSPKPTKESAPNITVSEPDGYNNGHGYVDLGLPSGTKWATCNIGASVPEGKGNYFAWGEINEKTNYSVTNSKTVNKELDYYQFDAARNKWGSTWQTPSMKQFQEIILKCNWIWGKLGNSVGYKIVGPNGKSIFLPAVGAKENNTILDNKQGNYWSSDTHSSNSFAYYLYFSDTKYTIDFCSRAYGKNIRPIINTTSTNQTYNNSNKSSNSPTTSQTNNRTNNSSSTSNNQMVGFWIYSEPSGAMAYVEGTYVGITPIYVSYPQGMYKVTVKKEGKEASGLIKIPLDNSIRLNLKNVKKKKK